MPTDLVTVSTYWSPQEAALARGLLEQHAITASIEGDVVASMAWQLGNATGGVKLQVAAEDASRALEILREQEDQPSSPEAWDQPDHCPRCGAEAEPGFDACWSCGAELTEEKGGRIDDRSAAPPPTEPSAADEATGDALPGDDLARRAWQSAVLGIFLCPPLLSVYSLWLSARVEVQRPPLSDPLRRRVRWAIAIDLVVCLGMLLLILLVGG